MKIKARNVFDKNISDQFKKAVKIMLRQPDKLFFYTNALKNQIKAARLRKKLLKDNLQIPPLMIISITKKCNLNCSACYSKILHESSAQEISGGRFRDILNEALELGISIIMLAGGEPLTRWDFIEIASQFPQIIFPIFTNGLLLDQDIINFIKKHPNLIPVISLEGKEDETDTRRGSGVWDNFLKLQAKLKEEKVFWGTSLTLTSENYDLILSDEYTKNLLNKGCSLFFYVEFVPIDPNHKHLVLKEEQKANLQPVIDRYMKEQPGLFVAFPGDEDQYGGCLAAGRGFFHINPFGLVEPCPFAPFSDQDILKTSIKDALESPLFRYIQDNHHLLKETEGGCALWANKDFLENINTNKE